MEIILYSKNSDQKYSYNLNFDEFGNLYIENNINIFQINISGKNFPYAELGNFAKLSLSNLPINNITIQEKNNQLKDQVDQEENSSEESPELDYFPEESEYFLNSPDCTNSEESFDDENIKIYGINNKKFKFYSDNQNKIIYKRENGDITALYDTYIYNQEKLKFVSNSAEQDSIYRLNIHTNGYLFFRPIGYPEINYKLFLDSDQIIFQEIK